MTLPYYSHELSRSACNPNAEAIAQVAELLQDEQVGAMAREGTLSLALIRPQVGPDANLEQLSDIDAANKIEERIQGLGVAVKFSFCFDGEGIEEFYEGPAKTESMMPAAPLKDGRFPSRWEEFRYLMTSGPTTALLLHGTDAIADWRAHLGNWNIEKNRDPATIRGALGVDNYNNLVHGSDSPAAVLREIDVIARCIQRQQHA